MRILMVGDTHANTAFFVGVVAAVADDLSADVVCVVGDFGYWEDGDFLDAVRSSERPVWFIDGNHEHHDVLAADVAAALETHPGACPVPLGGSLSYLPRGSRLEIEGVRIAFCGGAVSIDRSFRVPGQDYFAAEECIDADLELLASGGRAEVLVCHDAPAGWDIPGLPPMEVLPGAWRQQLPDCWAHRARLAEAVRAVAPELVVHGHYHSRYTRHVEVSWGSVRVEGLDCDGTGNAALGLLSLANGTWAFVDVDG